MKYEKIPVNIKPSKESIKSDQARELNRLSTSAILWHLVKRHKFGLVSFYAVAITVLYLMPFLPSLIATIIMGG